MVDGCPCRGPADWVGTEWSADWAYIHSQLASEYQTGADDCYAGHTAGCCPGRNSADAERGCGEGKAVSVDYSSSRGYALLLRHLSTFNIRCVPFGFPSQCDRACRFHPMGSVDHWRACISGCS